MRSVVMWTRRKQIVRWINGFQSTFILFCLFLVGCGPSQTVVLVGTHHTTPKERVNEVSPILEALKKFNPEVLCGEYVMPTDTPSLLYRGGDQIFLNADEKRKAWSLVGSDETAIQSLAAFLKEHPEDMGKRMELLERYYTSLDWANSDFQSYQVFQIAERDTAVAGQLRREFASYKKLKASYEHNRYRNTEYHILVFPLAKALGVQYIDPIDDLSTWTQYEKFFDRQEVVDSTDTFNMKYQQQLQDFRTRIDSIHGNRWIELNSPVVTEQLLSLEGYIINVDSVNENRKMLSHYWILRNRKMAENIDHVVRNHPGKNVAVFFGVSHVGPVHEELKKIKKKYRVLTLYDILKGN